MNKSVQIPAHMELTSSRGGTDEKETYRKRYSWLGGNNNCCEEKFNRKVRRER